MHLLATTQILTALYASRDALKARAYPRPSGITHPTLNVGLIEGGINTNVVPDRVTFRLDRRIIPEESPQAAEAELRQPHRGDSGAYSRHTRRDPARTAVAAPGEAARRGAVDGRTASSRREYFFGTPIVEHGVPIVHRRTPLHCRRHSDRALRRRAAHVGRSQWHTRQMKSCASRPAARDQDRGRCAGRIARRERLAAYGRTQPSRTTGDSRAPA